MVCDNRSFLETQAVAVSAWLDSLAKHPPHPPCPRAHTLPSCTQDSQEVARTCCFVKEMIHTGNTTTGAWGGNEEN